MKILTSDNNYEIIDTGTIITFNDEPLKFELTLGVTIIIKFILNTNLSAQKMDFNVISNTELELILTNFTSSLGTGNLSPLPLAKIDNKQVYLNFVVYALNETSNKTIHYTWYKREEVKNA
ncbi:MAG: hypothetical protein QM726_11210 [Chitinophagaceae bacterium]